MKKLLRFAPLLVVLAFAGCNIITGNVLVVIELDDAMQISKSGK